MKAAIYNPYLDTLGGGERYTAGVMRVLNERGYQVDVEWSDPLILSKMEARFGMKLSARVVPDVRRGDGYDFIFWVSDGSVPTLRARKNILHFQVPFTKVSGRSLINKMKLWRVNVVCNSNYTKAIIDREYGVSSTVIYPPVDIQMFKPKRKDNIILYVGRFSSLLQSKRQDILIEAFRKITLDLPDWKLVLAGGVEIGGQETIAELQKKAKGLRIDFVESPSLRDLKELFGRATLFWSAAGFGVDPKTEPEKQEHFGMTVVEAMAAQALPIAFEGGGHPEIITHGKNGILWSSTKELVTFTKNILKEREYMTGMIQEASLSAHRFSYEEFAKQFSTYL